MAAIKDVTPSTVQKPVFTQSQGVMTKSQPGDSVKIHPADAKFFKDHGVVS